MSLKNAKFAWIALILMTADLFLVGELGIKVSGFGMEQVGKLSDLGWSWMVSLLRYVNIAAMICLLYVVMTKAEAGRFWYLPTAAAGGIGLLAVLVILVMKNRILETAGMKGIMDMLSVECKLTETALYFAGTSILEIVCGVIPFMRKKAAD